MKKKSIKAWMVKDWFLFQDVTGHPRCSFPFAKKEDVKYKGLRRKEIPVPVKVRITIEELTPVERKER